MQVQETIFQWLLLILITANFNFFISPFVFLQILHALAEYLSHKYFTVAWKCLGLN